MLLCYIKFAGSIVSKILSNYNVNKSVVKLLAAIHTSAVSQTVLEAEAEINDISW